jgi:hypothetical protein
MTEIFFCGDGSRMTGLYLLRRREQDDGAFFCGDGSHRSRHPFAKSQRDLTMGSYAPQDSLLRDVHEIPLSIAFGGGSRMTEIFFCGDGSRMTGIYLLRPWEQDDGDLFATAIGAG